MSSNSEIFELNKDLEMQTEPPEAQDGFLQIISSDDEVKLSIYDSKVLETHENNTVDMKIHEATLNETASSITDDLVYVLPDSNQSSENSELSTNLPVMDKELSNESTAPKQVFEVKPLEQSDSTALGQEENQINEDSSGNEPNSMEYSMSETETNFKSETTVETVVTSQQPDNLTYQDTFSATQMDVDMELAVADKDEVIEPITAGQDADIELPTTDNPVDVKQSTPEMDLDVKQTSTVADVNVELPTVDIDADAELPMVDKDEDVAPHTAGKDGGVEPCIDYENANVRPPTVDEDADLELPVAEKDVSVEPHMANKDDVEPHTAGKDENVEPCIDDKNDVVEPPIVEKYADIRQSTAELPAVDMDSNVELGLADNDEDMKLHALETADENANVEPLTVERDEDIELLTANTPAKLPVADNDENVKLLTAYEDADIKLLTNEIDAAVGVPLTKENAELPTSDKDVALKQPHVEMDADVELHPDESHAPTIEEDENVPAAGNDADVQCPTANSNANVVKSPDGIKRNIELSTDDMNVDVRLSAPNSSDQLHIHKDHVESEVELIAGLTEEVKDIPTEKSNAEFQPIKATENIKDSTVDLNTSNELPLCENKTGVDHTDEMSVDDPTADSNVAAELTLPQQNMEEAASSSTVLGETGSKRTIHEDALPTGELNANAVKEPSDEPKSKKRKLDAGVNNYPAGLYLDNTIVPILRMALITLDRLRPQDPLQFIIDFLLQNKEKYSAKQEPLSNA